MVIPFALSLQAVRLHHPIYGAKEKDAIIPFRIDEGDMLYDAEAPLNHSAIAFATSSAPSERTRPRSESISRQRMK